MEYFLHTLIELTAIYDSVLVKSQKAQKCNLIVSMFQSSSHEKKAFILSELSKNKDVCNSWTEPNLQTLFQF
jgi:hypothetical protein